MWEITGWSKHDAQLWEGLKLKLTLKDTFTDRQVLFMGGRAAAKTWTFMRPWTTWMVRVWDGVAQGSLWWHQGHWVNPRLHDHISKVKFLVFTLQRRCRRPHLQSRLGRPLLSLFTAGRWRLFGWYFFYSLSLEGKSELIDEEGKKHWITRDVDQTGKRREETNRCKTQINKIVHTENTTLWNNSNT